MNNKRLFLLVLLALALNTALQAGIGFWLPRPTGRDNPNDPVNRKSVVVTPSVSTTASVSPTVTCTATYNFETGAQGWANGYDTGGTAVGVTTAVSSCGSQSLMFTVNLTGAGSTASPNPSKGEASISLTYTVDLRCTILSADVYASAALINATNPVQAMLFSQTTGDYLFVASASTSLTNTGWVHLTFDMSGAAATVSRTAQYGVQIALGAATPNLAGTVYIDNVALTTKGGCVLPTPSPTASASVTPGQWPIVYNGDSVPMGGNFYGSTSTVGGIEVTAAGAGAGGSNVYADVTMSCVAAAYSAIGVFDTGFYTGGLPITQTVAAASGYTALSISVKVASAAVNSCVVPSISLVTNNGGQKTSIPVSMETYLVGGPQFMSAGKWYTAVIPLSAFTYGTDGSGFNGKASPNGDTVTAADMAMLTAVQVEPSYLGDGSINTELYVDDIVFNNAAPTLNTAGVTPLFCDFEHGTSSNWGDYWASFEDQDKPDFTCAGVTDPTTRVFPTCGNCPNPAPAVTPPVTSGAGGPASPCNFGRIAGHVSNANPASETPPCTLEDPAGDYSYFGMGVYFLLSHNPADILSLIGSYFPGNGNRPHGIQLDIKAGPNATTAQTYTMFVTLDNVTCGGCDAGADLAPTGTWTTVQVPFPANGTVLTSVANASLKFAQPSWAPAAGVVTWDASGTSTDTLKHFQQLKFQADSRGVDIDLEVDNIQFY